MATRPTAERRTYDQACPVALSLDLVGERWTLLIVRDLMFGPLRFTDLRDGLPGLAPNLLSERLRTLTADGVIEQVELPPPAARTAYALTDRGLELAPVVHELARFGVGRWLDPDEHPPPERLVRGAVIALMSPEHLGRSSWSARLELADVHIGIVVAPPIDGAPPLYRLGLVQPVLPGHPAPDAVVRTSLGALLDLRRLECTRAQAEAAGRLEVVGPRRVVDQLARLFGWR